MLILFALLLAGVVAVLLMYVMQRREHHRETLRATVLAAQVELLKTAATDPALARLAAGPQLAAAESDEVRRHLFLDAQVTVLELQWRSGALPEPHLRAHAAAMLSSEAGRRYWQRARTVRAATVGEDSKLRVFHQVFDTACTESQAAASH
ncbi:DUF6082 family protein [Streptomyces sp. NPDC050204]|uniref:DUF6082 family protein n=1 Tax=Streptomyces sp. NPDC050204 TaxID=3155514 RepID=UPI003429CC9E